MKILLVGNGNQKFRGERYYDQCAKLYNGLVRNGHSVFFMSDRDVKREGMKFGITALGEKHARSYFLDTCRNYKPELIIFYHADVIKPDAIAEARQMLPSIKIAQLNVDIIFNEHNAAQIKSKLDVVDATFITTAGKGLKKFSQAGKIVSFVPNMADVSLEWPQCYAYSDQSNDVFWALRALKGSAEGDRRIDYPLYLEKNGVKIDYYGMNGKSLLYDARYFETIAKSKMGINISQIWTRGHYEKAADEDLYLYSSDRIAHYLGSGLLTFCTRDHKLEEMFAEDKEMIYFSSKEELLDKIRYYAERDEARGAIARAGWLKYHACYNERLVAKYMVERTLGLPLSEAYQWPTERF
jgi:hypothetical protein